MLPKRKKQLSLRLQKEAEERAVALAKENELAAAAKLKAEKAAEEQAVALAKEKN